MIILVTGASGFVGRHLTVFLEDSGHKVIKLSTSEIDLTCQKELEGIPKLDYDRIYHLAAWTRAGDFCEHHQGDQWIINQLINTNILHWWKENCPSAKLIAFGTSASYAPGLELSEDNYMVGLPNEKYYSYAMGKRMLLVGLQSFHRQFGMNYLYVVPSTVYGPNYHVDDRQLHFIYDLIKKIKASVGSGERAVLFGDGFQRRELVFIDDFVTILVQLSNILSNEIINVGSGMDYSIRDFAKIVSDFYKVDVGKIHYDANAYVGVKDKVLVVEKLDKYLKFNQTNLIEGLSRTIRWFNENNE